MAKISLRSYGKEIESLIDRGQYDQALAHCRHILRYYPKHIDTYRLMAKAYLEATRYGDASDVFQRVLSSIPDDFVSHLGMSIIREDEGNLDAAIWHMERAFEIQPANVAIQSELRRLYGRRDGMEPPRVRLTRGALARMYYKGELYQQAISELRAAMSTDGTRTDLQLMLAQAYLRAGQRVESAETCSAILKKLPYCLEANRILSEIMVGTERAQDAAIYRQRAITMNPYLGQVSPKALSPDQVPDEAVLVEKLDLRSEPASATPAQPAWAASLGVEIAAATQKKEEVPEWLADLQGVTQPPGKETDEEALTNQKVSPFVSSAFEENPELFLDLDQGDQTAQESTENLIPDWMKEAGWQPTKESSKEAEMGYSFGEGLTPEDEGLARAEIPDWLKAIAPKEAFEQPKEPEEVDSRLLEALDSAAAPWLEETPPGSGDTVASWLEGKEEHRAPSEPTEDKGLPVWLAGGAALAAAGVAAAGTEREGEDTHPEEAPTAEPSEQIPDWLSAETAAAAGSVAFIEPEAPTGSEEKLFAADVESPPAGEIPDWLRSLEPEVEESEQTGPGESVLPEWLVATAAVSQVDRGGEVAEETTPDWLSALEPVEQPAEESVTKEEEASAYAWLEELTAQEIPAEATFPTPQEEAEELAGWEPGGPREEEGISGWEAAGLGAVGLGAAALAASRSEEEVPEEELSPTEPFEAGAFEAGALEAGEWVPETFELEDEAVSAVATSDLFEPEAGSERAPEDVFPEWLRQANPEDIQESEEAAIGGDSSLPDWLRQMQAESETGESLWEYPPTIGIEAEQELDWLSEAEVGDKAADLSLLSESSQESETVDEWLRTQADQEEIEESPELSPFAAKFAEEEPATEEQVWLTEEFIEEKAPPQEEEGVPEWLAGLAAGAAAGALIGKEAETESVVQEEAPEEIAELEELSATIEPVEEESFGAMEAEMPSSEVAEVGITPELAEVESEVPDWLETIEKPAALAAAAGVIEAAREEEAPSVEAAETAAQPSMSDEDAAFAWLESLAVKQGATEALMYTDEERPEEPPEWVKQASPEEETVEVTIGELSAEPSDESVEMPAAEEAVSEGEEPEEGSHLPEWLLAAAAAGALITKEKDQAVSEDTQPTKPVSQIEEVEAIPAEEVETAGAVSSAVSESDIDDAYAWLEGLAVKQGAEEALLLTPEERQEEPPDWVKFEAETAGEEAPTEAMIEEAVPEEPVPATFAEELAPEEELPEDSDQSGIVGATILGMAAAASLEEEQPEVEEVVELEAAAQVHEEDITGLPEWLADLEEGITQPAEDETWTPERAAMTQPLTTPEEMPQREVQAPESFAAEPAKPEVARLDINQASLVELERLPGVGFIRAQALIEYRQANGPFESMLDLENVEGFDPDLVDVLRDYATILPRTQEIYPKYTGSGAQASLSNARQALTDGNVDEAIGIYQALMSDTDLLPEVVKDLNDALYRYPVDVSVWMTLGDAEMRSGQTQEALDAYTKAEELLR